MKVVSWSRSAILIASALVIATGAVWLSLATGDSHAAQPQTIYSVFSSATAGNAASSAPSSARPGEGNTPITASFTRVAVGNPNLTVYAAKSSEGGVCVFVERNGARGSGGSCADASLFASGAKAEVQEEGGDRIVAGVVPDGVSSVKVGFGSGTSQTVAVVDNGWVIENAPASVTSATDVAGG
jgi:hypothetical protein